MTKIVKIEKTELTGDYLEQYLDLVVLRDTEVYAPLPSRKREDIRSQIKIDDSGETKEHEYLILNDENAVGYGFWLEIPITQPNSNRVYSSIFINPKFRRQGYAKSLLTHMVNDLPARVTQINMRTHYNPNYQIDTKPSSPIDQKMYDMGGKFGTARILNGSRFRQFDPKQVQNRVVEFTNKAYSNGFEFVIIKNGKFRDHEKLNFEKFLKMREYIWNDMPLDQVTEDPEILTPEINDSLYYKMEELGQSSLTVVAVHRETNSPAGLSEFYFDINKPAQIKQDDTGVIPPYRGNKLGLTMKYMLLEKLLTEPKYSTAEWWTTSNATTNEHMLQINDELGYERMNCMVIFEFDRSVLQSKLSISN